MSDAAEPSRRSPALAIGAGRIEAVDAARGAALLAMAIYHFSWDLSFFQLIATPVGTDPAGKWFARAIAGSFLFLVGVSLVLGHGERIRWPPFTRRVAMIAAAAAAVTVVTYFAFPGSYIFFGILHCIAVSSLIGLAFLRAPLALVIALAVACLAAPWLLTSPAFNSVGWVWLGLASEQVPSNDYNPLLPWFAMVLLGITVARLIPSKSWPTWQPRDPVTRTLALAGRHSLLFYLAHQPVLLGVLWLVSKATG